MKQLMVPVSTLRAAAAEKKRAAAALSSSREHAAAADATTASQIPAESVQASSLPPSLPQHAPQPPSQLLPPLLPSAPAAEVAVSIGSWPPHGGLAAVAAVVRNSVINRIDHQRTTGMRTFMPLVPAEARGTMTALRAEAAHLSPAIGLALAAGGSALVRRLYDIRPARWPPPEGDEHDLGSTCGALTRQLFHRNHLDEVLRPTMNLSLVASHLSASMVAHVVGLAWRRPRDDIRDVLSRAVCSETGLTIGERVRGIVLIVPIIALAVDVTVSARPPDRALP